MWCIVRDCFGAEFDVVLAAASVDPACLVAALVAEALEKREYESGVSLNI